MTIDFSDPDFPVISLAIPKEMLREIVTDPYEGYLRIMKQKFVEAIEAEGHNSEVEDAYKKFAALQFVPGKYNN
jgi:hypothetical protein